MTDRRPDRTTHASALGRIKLVRNRRTGALSYVQRGVNQSTVDCNGVSVDNYIHALYALMMQTRAMRILMIGCGGGALASLLVNAGKVVTIVDIDPITFRLAKRHFGLPRSVTCHVGDGLTFLQSTRRRFDALVIDAFVGEKVPPQFLGDEFCNAARRCLKPDGALFFNVCLAARETTADRLAATLRQNDWRVRILDRRCAAERNAIVAAGYVRLLRKPKLLIVPTARTAELKMEMAAMYFRRPKYKAVTKRRSLAGKEKGRSRSRSALSVR